MLRSSTMMSIALALICLAITLTAVQGYIATPLVGYQQGVKLTITPAVSTNQQCNVYGVPTPWGYAQTAPTPLYLYTPKNTGTHVLEFDYDSDRYALSPFLAPDRTTLQIDDTNPEYPLISFDSTLSPQGASGYVHIALSDKANGATVCISQIQFYVDEPLSCLPYYGGVYTPGVPEPSNPPPISDGGGDVNTIIIPTNIQIYAPTFVQQTIINQFVTVNNIQINNIVTNVNVIQNNTIINNEARDVAVEPPVVNCTTSPEDPACTENAGPDSPVSPPTGATPTGPGAPPPGPGAPPPSPGAPPPGGPAATPPSNAFAPPPGNQGGSSSPPPAPFAASPPGFANGPTASGRRLSI